MRTMPCNALLARTSRRFQPAWLIHQGFLSFCSQRRFRIRQLLGRVDKSELVLHVGDMQKKFTLVLLELSLI